MKNKIVLGIAAFLLAIASWFVGLVGQPAKLGSIGDGQAYTSTTTAYVMNTAAYQALKGGGIFGSIIVNQVGTAGYLKVYDATSTATSTYQTDDVKNATLTIGKIIAHVLGTSDAAGTLVYDVQVVKGIVVETGDGYDGDYTITYRN